MTSSLSSPPMTKEILTNHQDPFRYGEWPSIETIQEKQRYQYGKDIHKENNTRQSFFKHYQLQKEIELDNLTTTAPMLYNLKAKSVNKDMNLIMKLVPFHVNNSPIVMVDEDVLEEIYNEIMIGYFLNDLVYGYNQVMSIHFRMVVDWFITRKETLLSCLAPNQRRFHEYDWADLQHKYHQVIILEKADITLEKYLSKNPSIKVLKAILFQVCHAIEVAWYTNEYIHHDLHTRNIMLSDVSSSLTFGNKHFLYKRAFEGQDNHWYRLDKDRDLRNHIVKIIDYGRNRMYVPSSSELKSMNTHDLLIEPDESWMSFGYSSGDKVNRQIDVYVLIMSILMREDDLWSKMIKDDEDTKSFFQFCDDILPFDEINDILSKISMYHPKVVQVHKEMKEYGRLNTSSLIKCTAVKSYLKEEAVFIYKHHSQNVNRPTISTMLNHSFFDEYKVKNDDQLNDVKSTIVVSFPTKHESIQLGNHASNSMDEELSSSSSSLSSMDIEESPPSSKQPHCSICHSNDVRSVIFHEHSDDHNDHDDNTLLCSNKLCYQFKYLFNGKTVLR